MAPWNTLDSQSLLLDSVGNSPEAYGVTYTLVIRSIYFILILLHVHLFSY